MKKSFTVQLTKASFRELLKQLSEHTTLSYPEIAKRSGVHFTTIYNVLRASPGDSKKRVHLSTVRKIAESLGFRISVSGNRVVLRPGKTPKNANPLRNFSRELNGVIHSLGYTQLSHRDRYRIKEMLRLLLKK